MTNQSPRIYTYKITFEEVPYYYYGVHKEKKFDEYYMGSPITNKWCWNFYTPKKQILEFFEYSDDGWNKALEVEKRIIKLFFNTEKWCLNKSCGSTISLDICRKNGEKYGPKNGKKLKDLGIGMFAFSAEEISKNAQKGGKIGGKKTYQLKVGVHGRTQEQMKIDAQKGGKVGGKVNLKNKTGVFGRSKEKMSEDGKKAAQRAKELGVGIHGRTKEQRIEDGRKGSKNTNSQKWICLETGFITNPGSLSRYQKARGIDTSKRKRIL